MSRCLKSGLAPAIRSMIDYKVSLGYEESTYLPRSHSLDRYCMEHFPDETSLTREVVTGWLERHPGESIGYFHSRAGYARGLGKYPASMGIPAFILPEKFTSGRSCFLPYIFTDSELKELFHVIDAQGSRENSLQPFLLSTVFRLIYTCGLRPNEGRMLKRESVNLKTGEILITETKGHKERIVVMSDDMTGLAASYARLRDAAYPDSPYFFPDRNGNPYSSPWMQNKFKAFFAAANPGVDPDMLPPVRIYDLRHRFASAALSRWLDSGENLFNRLPYLRAYMGHKELSATVYYIHLLPENLVKSAGIEWDSLRRMILKEEADNNEVLVENAHSETAAFALLFEFDGDIRKIRHVLYNCSASRPKIEGKTNEESREVQTETLTIKARPLASGYVKAKTGNKTSAETYANWYKSVYLPEPKAVDADTEGQG